jgi:hypothetical protein
MSNFGISNSGMTGAAAFAGFGLMLVSVMASSLGLGGLLFRQARKTACRKDSIAHGASQEEIVRRTKYLSSWKYLGFGLDGVRCCLGGS